MPIPLNDDNSDSLGSHPAVCNVPVVDLTDGDDILCSVFGFADGILERCGGPVHPECDGFCPRCGAEQPENDELEECTLCRSELTGDNRFVVPCCHQVLHLDCLVRSFNLCGVRCPFCQTDLSSLAGSSQFQQILGRPIQFDQPIPDPIHQPMVPVPPMIWPLCCPQVGGPPDFALLEDRRMEWSPIQPDASGSSAWTFQWVCLTCSRTLNVNDVHPMPEATCPGCQQNAGAVLDVTTGNVRRVCTSCNCVVTVPDAVEERRDWFSSGPLTRLGPLYGWGSSSPSLPGEGLQSWLFCPVISLGLLVVEARRAVPAYSTGPRAPGPDSQAQFWTSRARDVIHAFSDNPLAVTLSSQVSWVPQEIIWKLAFRRHSLLSTSHQ